ncbi:MAG: YggS family pyridoxal phosphate-dependent enzyme [Clostridia bacterium]|nr:YggS family pyridoxal phosphate-dependent enzyme [Clostridia bacterium]
MDAARARAGRTDEVKLIVAAKSGTPEELTYLFERHGVRDIGENRVQQLLEHYEQLPREMNIHFIGHLQTNKVKYIVDKVCMIHSVDSERLAAEIDKQARKHGVVMRVLVEINIGEEENKSGVMPSEAEALCAAIGKYPNLSLCGLMTMAPNCEKKEDYLKFFEKIYRLSVDIWGKNCDNKESPILSMGMSGSFEEAIASGATAVRVGRKLFEK